MDLRIIILLLFLGLTFAKYPIVLLTLSIALLGFVLLVKIGFMDFICEKFAKK